MRHVWPLLILAVTAACATAPPPNVENVCEIFRDKRGWYDDARDASDRWNSPIPVLMAIIHQESRFLARARPPRRKILGFIPGPRPSDSYGYSQALKSTWRAYERSAGNYGADRDDFDDAVDFVAWYNHQSRLRNGIRPDDAYRLYLAYHEGHGGFARGSFRDKAWLQGVAGKVARRTTVYRGQLAACEAEFQEDGWFFGWF